MLVTIAEVASHAGTSSAAVSYVLNNRPGMVGAATRERILRAAHELGYRPRRHARQMRKKANLVITVHLDSTIISDNSWRASGSLTLQIIQGIGFHATSRNYHLHLLLPRQGDDVEAVDNQVISENAVDGVVFMGFSDTSPGERFDQLLDRMRRLKIPAVTIDRRVAQRGIPAVYLDLRPGIQAVAARLRALGHRRVGYLGLTRSMTVSEQTPRFELFQQALREQGVELDTVVTIRSELDAYRQTLKLAASGRLPSCLIYTADHHAMAGVEALADHGLAVPQDVSVVAMGNAPYAAASRVPLATIDQRYFDQGVTLAKLLLDRIEGKEAPSPTATLLPSRFIERVSLGRINSPL